MVGEPAFYKGSDHTFESGDRVEYGLQGEVTGPYLEDPHNVVCVKFRGHTGNVSCLLPQLSRTTPPPLQVRL